MSEESVRFSSLMTLSQSKIENLFAIPIMVCMVPRTFVPQVEPGKGQLFLRHTALEGQNYFSNGIKLYRVNAKAMFD
ncbi:hypothetical protein [Sphingobacterium mizutaii]|uniref:hypothetical protein n=1 Tax=Sphingobacterium mizutaii TaxID=1010 RepID=UPI0028987476|nr:hypothetical protein [Sphingobacterium mizutaii]